MNTEKETKKTEGPVRRLSPIRVVLALLVIAGLSYFAFLSFRQWQDNRFIGNSNPWFAPYVDVTATPYYDFEKLGTTPAKNVVLSFIVSSAEDACIPSWGKAYSLDKANTQLDLDRRIARLRQLGGDIAVSFGGLLNDELATNCTDSQKLSAAYKSVIEKYSVYTLDFDLEGNGLSEDAAARRAKVLADLQQELRDQGKNLAIWLTLPVIPSGLTESGTNAVAAMLANGVDLAGVNIMTMNYGQSRVTGQTMEQASERALIETQRQLGILYKNAGINLSDSTLWKKIGATPMIGQNDVLTDIFTLEDAKALNKFVASKGIIRVSMWSANRDIQCGENYANLTMVSDSCSGIKQDSLAFIYALSSEMDGTIMQNIVTTQEDGQENANDIDDPASSPYQIWSELNVYLEGTKVVWHKNVYQAKWWTQGDLPDNPVLQSWQTPWQLIGPVLPGEKPVAQLTLPEGTYPTWSGTTQYDSGNRVMFNGVPYVAKWWTQGDSPAAATADPTSSPWLALTQAQIEEILRENK